MPKYFLPPVCGRCGSEESLEINPHSLEGHRTRVLCASYVILLEVPRSKGRTVRTCYGKTRHVDSAADVSGSEDEVADGTCDESVEEIDSDTELDDVVNFDDSSRESSESSKSSKDSEDPVLDSTNVSFKRRKR